MMLKRWLVAISAMTFPAVALADTSRIPEPETLSLLAAGVIAFVIARTRGRKK